MGMSVSDVPNLARMADTVEITFEFPCCFSNNVIGIQTYKILRKPCHVIAKLNYIDTLVIAPIGLSHLAACLQMNSI